MAPLQKMSRFKGERELGKKIAKYKNKSVCVILKCLRRQILLRGQVISPISTECSLNIVFFFIEFSIISEWSANKELLYTLAQVSCSSICKGWVAKNWGKTQFIMNTLYIFLSILLRIYLFFFMTVCLLLYYCR